MARTLKMAVSVLSLTLALSALALAWDDDDFYRQGGPAQAQQYGYSNGFRDGENRGRHEGRESDPYDYRSPDRQRATRGYQGWMGPVVFYERGYQQGYAEGFRSGFASMSNSGDYRNHEGDHDAYRGYGGQGSFYHGGYYEDSQTIAARWGYQDGSDEARNDLERGKRYNSKPRGKYDDCDRGYRREFGSKDAYKAAYREAFQRGYDDTMNGRRY